LKDSIEGHTVSNFLNRTFFLRLRSGCSGVGSIFESFRRSNLRLLPNWRLLPPRFRKLPMKLPQFKLPQSKPPLSDGRSSRSSLLPTCKGLLASSFSPMLMLPILTSQFFWLPSFSPSNSCRRSLRSIEISLFVRCPKTVRFVCTSDPLRSANSSLWSSKSSLLWSDERLAVEPSSSSIV